MPSDQGSRKFQKELNSGAISLVLLSLLEQHGEPMYGYEIGKRLEAHANGQLPMNQGAIYPVLRSLEKQGLLRSQSLPSESGPPRKYYQLTAVGKRALSSWVMTWDDYTRFVNSVLETKHAKGADHGGDSLPRSTREMPQRKKRSRS